MNRLNLKNLTPETVTGILMLTLSLINMILQLFGINTLPIENEEISKTVSSVFVILLTSWNTWKNRNFTTFAQQLQQVADALKQGELSENDIEELMKKGG